MARLIRKAVLFALLGSFGVLLIWVSGDLPDRADTQAAANQHVSSEYLLRAKAETGASNVVTAVLADYRSYDTLGELVVIATAGLACAFVLRSASRNR